MKLKEMMIVSALIIVGLVVLVGARNIIQGTGDDGFSSFRPASAGSNNVQNSDGQAAVVQNGIQKIKLGYERGQYQLQPSTLKKGVPVEMEVDLSKVTGCMTAVTIPGFNVRKLVGPGDNVIRFTPDKAGTFQIACSMGMGRNTFNVVDETGSAGSYVEAPAAGGSCGGSGGCGCGGGKL